MEGVLTVVSIAWKRGGVALATVRSEAAAMELVGVAALAGN